MRLLPISMVALTIAVAACSGPGSPSESGFAAAPAAAVEPQVVDNPDTRVLQVAWTTARADKCQFFYDLPALKSAYLASEQSAGASPESLARLDKSFEFTRGSVAGRIATNDGYCSKQSNVNDIRTDLNRYLAGDFSTRAVKKLTTVE